MQYPFSLGKKNVQKGIFKMPKGDRFKLKADPEDGTTPIANLLLEAVAMAKISGLQKGAILYLWRKTYGWSDANGQRLKESKIPLAEWARALDSATPRCSSALSELEEKGILKRRMADAWGGYFYSINTDITEWNSHSVNLTKLSESAGITDFGTITENGTITETDNTSILDNSYPKKNRTITENGIELLPKTERPTLYKENIKKDKESIVGIPINGTITENGTPTEVRLTTKGDPIEWTLWRKQVFVQLKERRQYPLTQGQLAGEAKQMTWLFRNGYTPEKIIEGYDRLKRQNFWSNKLLTLMSVAKQIGQVLESETRQPVVPNGNTLQGKYSGMIRKK